MKIEFNKKYFTVAVYTFAVIACSILFFMFMQGFETVKIFVSKILGIIAPFLYGFCIAYIVNPIMVMLEKLFRLADKKGKLKKAYRGFSIGFSFLLIFAFLGAFIAIAGPQIKESLSSLYMRIQEWAPGAIKYVENLVTDTEYAIILEEQVEKYISTLSTLIINASKVSLTSVWGSVKSVTVVLYNLLIGFVVAVYMLAGKENFIYNIKKVLFTFLSNKRASSVINISTKANRIFSEFIQGKIIDSIIIGIICTIGMFILRLPFAALIGLLVGITNVIPYFGAWIGGVLGSLFILIVSPVQALIFLIFILILQQIDGNVIGPKILGDSTGMSSFWVMFAILVGGGFFGVLGMFVGVPVFALIYSLFVSYVDEKYKEKTKVATNSETPDTSNT